MRIESLVRDSWPVTGRLRGGIGGRVVDDGEGSCSVWISLGRVGW